MSGHRGVAVCIVALSLSTILLGACGTLPSLENRSTSAALLDTDTIQLGRAIAPRVDAHPGRSGIYPLPDARDAFAARVLLAQAAERTLDAQYYIWHNDMTGTLLFEAARGHRRSRCPRAAIARRQPHIRARHDARGA
jgi:cardiolipin synthase C